MANKEEKYTVFKNEDLAELIISDSRARIDFGRLVERYESYRRSKGKKSASYIVCNQDEPYAEEVWRMILDGEDKKKTEAEEALK